MGRYFGICNRTQAHSVSEGVCCWKADPNCNVHSVMHRYGWKPTDSIVSSAYDSAYVFKHSPSENIMVCYDIEDDDDDADINFEDPIEEDVPRVSVSLGFSMTSDEIQQTDDHSPVWKDGTCTHCGYKFEPGNVDQDKVKFNSVFFCN